MAAGSKKGACSSNTQPAKRNCLEHNRRERKVPTYVDSSRTHLNRKVFESELIKKRKSIVPLIERAKIRYTEKTGQKCQASFAPYRESVLHVKEGVTDEQLMKFKETAEALMGWKVIGIWLHQDEGAVRSKYIEGDEDFQVNYHAHVLWDCCDPESGKVLRPTRGKFSAMQDLLADAVGMERGTPAAETGIRHRSSQKQRIKAQEERIEELQRVVSCLEESHITAQQELDRIRRESLDYVTKSNEEIKRLQIEAETSRQEIARLNSTIEEAKTRLQGVAEGAKEAVLDIFTRKSRKKIEEAEKNAQKALDKAGSLVKQSENREAVWKSSYNEANELLKRKKSDIEAMEAQIRATIEMFPYAENLQKNLDTLHRIGLPEEYIKTLFRQGKVNYSGILMNYASRVVQVNDVLLQLLRSKGGELLVWLNKNSPERFFMQQKQALTAQKQEHKTEEEQQGESVRTWPKR